MYNSNVESFKQIYNQFEETIRYKYNLRKGESVCHFLQKENKIEYRRYKVEIESFTEIRNFIVHEKKPGMYDWVIPSDEALEKMNEIIEYSKHRPKVLDIAVCGKDIYARRLSDHVKSTMKYMRENMYTHVPIMEDGKVIGIFDENSIFGYLAENEILLEKNDDIVFEEIQAYLNIHGREMEQFLFVSQNTYADDLEIEFEKSFKQDVRLGAVFVTNNGNENERVLGMLTPWDILGRTK